MEIPLTQGKVALIDECDGDLIKFNWSARHDRKERYYAVRWSPDRETSHVKMHRIILERMLGRRLLASEQGDHINHDTLDNRRSNLRIANHRQNTINRQKQPGTSSIYKGVSWDKEWHKWRAGIMVEKKRIHLGYFNNEQDAAKAYDAAAKRIFLSFCALNFPEEEQGTD
jgi:hypothetical protein